MNERPTTTWFGQLIALAIFVALVVGVGGTIGALTAPGAWYAGLEKPPFNPPNWIFAPVWLALYLAIAVAGWRIFLRAPASNTMKLWVVQLILNWVWSPVFFSAQRPWIAFGVIALLLFVIAVFIHTARRHDIWAAVLFVPYFIWVAFASVLNLSIALLNG